MQRQAQTYTHRHTQKRENRNSLKVLAKCALALISKEPQRLKTDLAVLCNCSTLNGFALRFQSTKRMKDNKRRKEEEQQQQQQKAHGVQKRT